MSIGPEPISKQMADQLKGSTGQLMAQIARAARTVLCILPVAWSLFAQGTNTEPSQLPAAGGEPEYHLGAGDVLFIDVKGLKEFKRNYFVSNSGKIHIPYLGILTVTELTPSQLESEIGKRLREKKLLEEPVWVQVGVVESRAHTVYILGEVMTPGQYTIKGDMHLSDLIFLGVGFNEVNSRFGILYRRNCTATQPDSSDSNGKDKFQQCTLNEVVKVDFKDMLEGKHPELNLKLRGGDILHVPERRPEFLYVVGDVLRAGAIEIPFNTRILSSQAIAQAGGPLKTAKMTKGLLLRYGEGGQRQEIAVDLEAILKGKKPDFPVQPNDIIFIPGSRAKTLGSGLLGIIPGIASRSVIF